MPEPGVYKDQTMRRTVFTMLLLVMATLPARAQISDGVSAINGPLYVFDSTGARIGLVASLDMNSAKVAFKYRNGRPFVLGFYRSGVGGQGVVYFTDTTCSTTPYLIEETFFPLLQSVIARTNLYLGNLSVPAQTLDTYSSYDPSFAACTAHHNRYLQREALVIPNFTNRYVPPFSVRAAPLPQASSPIAPTPSGVISMPSLR